MPSQVVQLRDRPPKRLARGPELVTLPQDGAEFVSRCRFPFEELEQPIIQAVVLEVQLERIRAQVGDRVVCALSGVVARRSRINPLKDLWKVVREALTIRKNLRRGVYSEPVRALPAAA